MSGCEYVLETKDLCKSYGKSKILRKLNIRVPKGSIYGFVGKNGAGKTTLIRIVCGLQYQDSGDMIICGVKNTDTEINNVRKRFGAIVETPALHLNMTAKENIELQLSVLGIKDSKKADALLEFVGLADTGKKTSGNFSLGMRQRLAIAIAICGDPEFIILDEPINGLDPQGIIDMRDLLNKINKDRNITILISSHILDELARVATHYGFIADGQIVAEMSADELEATSQRKTILNVNKTEKIELALANFSNKYEINDDNTVIVYGDILVTDLILALHNQGIFVNRLIDKEESLEERFFELLGGVIND